MVSGPKRFAYSFRARFRFSDCVQIKQNVIYSKAYLIKIIQKLRFIHSVRRAGPVRLRGAALSGGDILPG